MAKQATARRARSARSVEQALAHHRDGRLDDADRIYCDVLSADPHYFDALHLSGMLRHQQGRSVDGLRMVAAALKAKPKAADARMNYGVILVALERYEEALASFDQALAMGLGGAVLHYNRGNVLKGLGRHEEALASFDCILKLKPELTDRISALNSRGKMLAKLKRFDEALASYDQVLALAPDHVDALTRRGVALVELGHYDEALAAHAAALHIDPDYIDAHLNRGKVYAFLNQFDAALTDYAAAMARQPEHADANFNEALVRLCLGDFRCGWPKYEYRWHCKQYASLRTKFPRPVWHGDQDLSGKTILLCAEQGMGDAIQFVRYAPLVAARGAKVLVGVHGPLTAVMACVPGVAQVIADGETLPDFDLYCSLLSLPLAFGTELATIPSTVPYIRPQPDRMARWQGRVPQNGRLRVGICWAGNSLHPGDRRRSIPLDTFAKILPGGGVDFVSLQKDVSAAQAAILNAHGVTQLGQDLTDFADTAAVVAMLDLVIAVDTSVAHLAGAMGKAVGLLLPFSPDWRWMLEHTDTPWYPTMRLFRQSAIGDWNGPLERVRQELAGLASRPGQPVPRIATTARG